MPRPTEHIAQAEKNERLYEILLGTEFNDWAVTALFYAALHYVDAYIASSTGVSPSNHSARNYLVDSAPSLIVISQAYSNLYRLSRDVRYEIFPVSTDAARRAKEQRFDPIRTHLRALLGLP